MIKAWKRVELGDKIRHSILIVGCLMMLYPVLFTIMTSFKSDSEMAVNYFWPNFRAMHPENYVFGWLTVSPYIWNSIKVSGLTLVGVLVLSCPTAYIFARYSFPGKEILYLAFLALMMIPSILTVIPSFVLVRNLGLLNTHWSLIIPWCAAAPGGQILAVFLLRSFFATIPQELVECARIDGAGEVRIIRNIMVPMSIPMIMTIAVLNILSTWNQFIWPLLTISDEKLRTIPVGIQMLASQIAGIKFTQMMAAYMLSSVPMAILFIFTMRYFVEGLSSGAIKG